MRRKQQTLKKKERYSGITLHTGVRAHLTLKPAPDDTGIRLVRVDLPGSPTIQALATNVVDVQRATTLANGSASVHTVEHVLAALYACEIDNAIIEMDGPEPPIADGSSDPYVAMIVNSGIQGQNADRKYFKIKSPVFIRLGESKLIALPSKDYTLSCMVKYGSSQVDTQYLSMPIDRDSFIRELSKARTFCNYDEIEGLMRQGLIRGGSLDNAIVLKDQVIFCKDGLRFRDEFVRHKILDIIGDLSLVGRRILGEIIAIKPGHPSNVAMAQEMIKVINNGKN